MAALFSLPNGIPASFYLHNFQNEKLTDNILVSHPFPFHRPLVRLTFPQSNGGRITHDEATADVVLTTSRDEYKSLKDQYAISRKTYVRFSGFVDRCINSRKFQLAPLVEKGVPGRQPRSR
jgi:hypothetical protein